MSGSASAVQSLRDAHVTVFTFVPPVYQSTGKVTCHGPETPEIPEFPDFPDFPDFPEFPEFPEFPDFPDFPEFPAALLKTTNALPFGGKSSRTTVRPPSTRHSAASAISPVSASQISGTFPAIRNDASNEMFVVLPHATKYQSSHGGALVARARPVRCIQATSAKSHVKSGATPSRFSASVGGHSITPFAHVESTSVA